MRTGITQDQVNGAADALAGAGENPTVEKIRAALGTGSPNTVTRMLDVWRRQLGQRLQQVIALPEVPDNVGRLMQELWRLATEHAAQQASARLADERATITVEATRLASERTHWVATLAEAEAALAQSRGRQELAEHACATLDSQLQDSHALRADLILQRNRLQESVDELQASTERHRSELAARDTQAREELERQAAYARDVENRAHQEVDRAREENRTLRGQLEALRRDLTTQLTEAGRQRDALQVALSAAEKLAAREAGRASALEQSLTRSVNSSKSSRRPRVTASTKSKKKPAKAAGSQTKPRKRAPRTVGTP